MPFSIVGNLDARAQRLKKFLMSQKSCRFARLFGHCVGNGTKVDFSSEQK
jgi:hypothetical protein